MSEWRITVSSQERRIEGPGFSGVAEAWLKTVTEGDKRWPLPKDWVAGTPPDSEEEDGLKAPGNAASWAVGRTIEQFHRSDKASSEFGQLGRYATELLGGTALLDQIDLAPGPVALRVAAQGPLETLPWELMAGRNQPLLIERRVELSRVIDRPPPKVFTQLSQPLRVLFVVGCPVDDRQIAPALEIMGVLRRAEPLGALPLQTRVVLDATLERVEQAVVAFKPHVVHLVAHGSMQNGGGGLVQLQTANGQVDDVTADRFFARLAAAVPSVVVVNACDSAGGDARGFPSPGNAPFGLMLARLGVPAVVAMSGRVADNAARAFSRVLYRWLADGKEPHAAVALARERGIGLDLGMKENLSWARPVVFGDFPAPAAAALPAAAFVKAADSLRNLYGSVFANSEFGFCDRVAISSVWQEMLDTRKPAFLPVGVPAATAKGVQLGCSWLLKSLALQALASGHLPLVIDLETRQDEAVKPPPNVPVPLVKLRETLDPLRAWIVRVDTETDTWATETGVTAPTILSDLISRVGAPGSEKELDLTSLSAQHPGIDTKPLKRIADNQLAAEIPIRQAIELFNQGVRLHLQALQAECRARLRGDVRLVILVDSVERGQLEGLGLLGVLVRRGASLGLGASPDDPVLAVIAVDQRPDRSDGRFQVAFAELLGAEGVRRPAELRRWDRPSEWEQVVDEFLLSVREVAGAPVAGLTFHSAAKREVLLPFLNAATNQVAGSLGLAMSPITMVFNNAVVPVKDDELLKLLGVNL